jgi:glycosyltransferase involved in cell wall biosynthesis
MNLEPKKSSPLRKSPRPSIVIPARNEAAGIAGTIAVIADIVEPITPEWEIIVVDDGSEDSTFGVLQDLAGRDPRVRGIRLSRNFGKEAALLAGLRHARGDCVITIDADLQHPPGIIPEMIACWQQGAMIVNGVKRSRSEDSRIARWRAKIFNAILSRLGGMAVDNSSDFKLLDRNVVETIVDRLPERERFYRGLTEWIGYPSAVVEFDVDVRSQGEGQWSIWRLVELALTAVVSFTSAPLRIVTVLGVLTLMLGFLVGADALISWMGGKAISGFVTLIMTLLIIGSFVMISLGIVGEYIAKIYEEVKRRPAFLIETTTDE